MANEIPPFLPASPPPMCKLDFDEDDDEDEFGDFSIASESCYHDNVSVSKVTSDNELNNTKQVFDPGAIYIEAFPNHENSLNHNIISNGIKENSFDDFGENYENGSCTNLPVGKLSLENQSDTEIDVFNSTEKCHNDNLDVTSESHVPIDSIANNTVPPVDVLASSAVTNCNGISADTNSIEEDSSIDDSISINCDKNSAANNDTNSINFENEELENDENIPSFVATEDGIENESPSKCTESTSTADDFTFFKGVESEEKPSSTRISPPSSVTESNTSQRRMSEDSDDSNVPDIDFSCFITCPNEIENENISKEDDFGDFAGPPEINFFNKTIDDSSPSHSNATLDLPDDQIRPNRLNPVPQVTIGQIPVEQCNDADDDFADFVSTNCQPLVNNNPQIDEDEFESFSDCYSKTDSFQCAVQKEPSFAPQVESNSTKTYDLDMECWNEVFQVQAQEQIEVNLNTFEGKLNGSSVWCKIKEIESSPALTYNWNNSETQKMLLSALYVDSRNILFGPRWNSEVPRFASNLGFSPLVPQKALDKKDDQPVEHIKHPPAENISLIDDNIAPHVPGSVPEAHFDWNNSGLTNPLDSYSHSSLLDLDLLASFDIHSPYYKTNRKNEKRKAVDLNPTSYENSLFAKTPHRENLSEEAKEVLNNLPNLYVMEKQYIVFPVS